MLDGQRGQDQQSRRVRHVGPERPERVEEPDEREDGDAQKDERVPGEPSFRLEPDFGRVPFARERVDAAGDRQPGQRRDADELGGRRERRRREPPLDGAAQERVEQPQRDRRVQQEGCDHDGEVVPVPLRAGVDHVPRRARELEVTDLVDRNVVAITDGLVGVLVKGHPGERGQRQQPPSASAERAEGASQVGRHRLWGELYAGDKK